MEWSTVLGTDGALGKGGGQLGDGPMNDRQSPYGCGGRRPDFLVIASGEAHTCGWRAPERSTAGGQNILGQLGIGPTSAIGMCLRLVGGN